MGGGVILFLIALRMIFPPPLSATLLRGIRTFAGQLRGA